MTEKEAAGTPARSRLLRRIAAFAYWPIAIAISVYAALFLFDRYYAAPLDQRILGEAGGAPLRELDLYPFTGFHVRANHHATGFLEPGQPYKDFDVRSGDLGFFGIDFAQIPPKKQGEIRVVLVGGSGAQGWGGRRNEDMLYVRLAHHLNAALAKCGATVSVFNMAMGGSISYQNFVALNLWGHRLEPDLILSYSGLNDFSIITYYGSRVYYRFPELLTMFELQRSVEFPPGTVSAAVDGLFPNLMRKTSIGTMARMFNVDYYRNESLRKYLALVRTADGLPEQPGDAAAAFRRVTHPFYVHALRSIKRDFEGIPIAVVYQAEKAWEGDNKKLYDGWFEQIAESLRGYMNDDWIFLNGHAYMQQYPEANTGAHLGNAGQDILAARLAQELAAFFLRKPKLAGCTGAGNPSGSR